MSKSGKSRHAFQGATTSVRSGQVVTVLLHIVIIVVEHSAGSKWQKLRKGGTPIGRDSDGMMVYSASGEK